MFSMITEWSRQIKPQRIQKSIIQCNTLVRTTLVALLTLVTIVAVGQTDLPTTPNSILLDGHVYTVSTSTTITATNAGEAGLRVRQNARVVINIKAGVTLTVKGADADADAGFAGMPGILVPENSTLVIIGEGKLIATGGKASNGLSGQNGEDAAGRPSGVSLDNTNRRFTYTYSDQFPNYGGYGGAGGDGGYGAGAAIGGYGGIGGKGGAQRERGAVGTSYTGLEGNAGSPGTVSGGMGKVYILGNVDASKTTLTVSATAGAAGSIGTAGTNGYYGYTTSKVNNKYYSIGGGGAGGGGAAGGKPSYSIGAGGLAGGGGGSGGQGGADNNGSYTIVHQQKNLFNIGNWNMNTSLSSCMAGAGEAGLGATNDLKGGFAGGTRDDGAGRTLNLWILGTYYYYNQKGGAAGAAGAAGTSGEQGNLYILSTTQANAYKRINNSSSKPANQTAWITSAQLTSNYSDIVKLYQIKLSFDNQGGSAARADLLMIKGDAVTSLTSFTIPTKSGYYFDGYYTEPEGGERIFDHNGNVVDGTRTFIEDENLYAHWIKNEFTITWDYSYVNQSGSLQHLNTTDKSKYAKVQFNVGSAFVATAGSETDGAGVFAGHRIATATITAQVGSGSNTSSTIYVTEEQLRTLQISATALSSNNITATDNKYISNNSSTHEVVLSAIPSGTFMQEWSVNITNEKKPTVLNVKLLRSNSEDGDYEVISQHTTAFACSNVEGTYSGIYPVWPESTLNEKLYYKIQIVGYEMDGVPHNVNSMPLSTDVSSNDNQIILTQSIALPILHLNLNAPTGTHPHYAQGTTEYVYATALGENISLEGFKAQLENYRFEGWTYVADSDTKTTSVTANGDVSVYASWADAIPPVINFTGSRLNETTDPQGYVHGSMDVYVHIEDANDGTSTQQWYYIADNKNETPTEGQWMPLTNGQNGTYTVTIEGTSFSFGYVYIKAKDNDGNYSNVISNQYKVDNQAPMIYHNPAGKRDGVYSFVCVDVLEDAQHNKIYKPVELWVEDNVGVTNITINGTNVTNKDNNNYPVGVNYNSTTKRFQLEKPDENDRERDDDGNPIGPVPEFKIYTVTARDAAGNTSTRLIQVRVDHEWEKPDTPHSDDPADPENYVWEAAYEPTAEGPGMLANVKCTHCDRYRMFINNSILQKLDMENDYDRSLVELPVGCILVRNNIDIFAGKPSINAALLYAKDNVNADDYLKLTPNTIGAKVDGTDDIVEFLDPERSITLDLNGQSIDWNGNPYTEVTGNANVTILLNDGNNRKTEFNNVDEIPYTNKSKVVSSPLLYKRTFSNTQKNSRWQSIYLPFSLTNVPDGVTFGKVYDVVINSDGTTNLIVDTNVGTPEANKAYFIHSNNNVIELTAESTSAVLKPKESTSVVIKDGYTIQGSLTANDQLSTAEDHFWVINNSGKFARAAAGQTQRPYRWVIRGPEIDRPAQNQYAAKSITLMTLFEDYFPTNVNSVLEAGSMENCEIYSISGVKMQKKSVLSRGIYIRNGKKFVVK